VEVAGASGLALWSAEKTALIHSIEASAHPQTRRPTGPSRGWAGLPTVINRRRKPLRQRGADPAGGFRLVCSDRYGPAAKGTKVFLTDGATLCAGGGLPGSAGWAPAWATIVQADGRGRCSRRLHDQGPSRPVAPRVAGARFRSSTTAVSITPLCRNWARFYGSGGIVVMTTAPNMVALAAFCHGVLPG